MDSNVGSKQKHMTTPHEYILTNGRVFITQGTPGLREGLAVHVRGDKIVAVDQTAAMAGHIPQVDVAGRAILPGLIDVHVHSEEWHAPLYLANGITTVRDVGCPLEQAIDRKQRWNAPSSVLPRFVCTGPLLDGGSATHTKTMWVVKTPDEGRAAVDRLVEAGVDQIKLYAWTRWPTFQAILERSQHYGKFTLAHMMNYVDAATAVRAGLNEIEHCSGCGEAMYPERGLALEPWRQIFPDLERDRMMRLIDLLLERGVWMAVTRVIWYKLATEWEPRHWDAAGLRYAPPLLHNWWRARPPGTFTRQYRLDWARAWGAMQIFVANLIDRGVKIIAGSDCPCMHVMPGFGLHEELQLLVECGMTPTEAILSATDLAAQALEWQGQVGSIEAGQWADFVLVDGDPTTDIRALQKPWRVVRGGQFCDPADQLTQAARYADTVEDTGQRRFSEIY